MAKLIIIYLVATFISFTNGSSMLTDEKTNASKNVDYSRKGNGTDILRQLLNQETLIRMSLSKDVHMLMNAVVELKEKQMRTESEVIDLRKEVDGLKQENKKLKQENHEKSTEIVQLKQDYANVQKELIKVNETFKETDESILQIAQNQKVFELQVKQREKDYASIQNELIKVNQTFKETEESILQIAENQKVFEVRVKQREKDFEQNTSDVLKDLKIEVRYMSVTLLDLNKHTLEIDKNIPQLVASNVKNVSEHLNKSFEDLAFDLTNSKAKQKNTLVSAITELEVFRSNLSKLTTDSISQIKEEIHETHDIQLKQAAKLSTLEFKVNISSTAQSKRRVGFTAGMVSGSSSWSSGTLVFPKIIFQIGGGYNNGSGVFTAPVGGNYVFYVNIVPYADYRVDVEIVLNGNSKVRTMSYHSGGSQFQVGTNMVLLHLKQGDNVWVKHYRGKGYDTYSDAPLTTFSGFLL